jgi:beta-lactamase class A
MVSNLNALGRVHFAVQQECGRVAAMKIIDSLRRTLMRAAALLPLLASAPVNANDSVTAALSAMEKKFGGRIGVVAIDTGSGKRIAHRPDERFPMCSSFKMVLLLPSSARA